MNESIAPTHDELAPLPEAAELEEIPQVRNIEVWATIKKSSKYYHQGLVDPTNPRSKPRFFKLSHFTPLFRGDGLSLSRDAYVLHFNSNAYRIEDCMLFLRAADDAKMFLRIC
jgi:hypothetical protein